jgi:hypothetical protein
MFRLLDPILLLARFEDCDWFTKKRYHAVRVKLPLRRELLEWGHSCLKLKVRILASRVKGLLDPFLRGVTNTFNSPHPKEQTARAFSEWSRQYTRA